MLVIPSNTSHHCGTGRLVRCICMCNACCFGPSDRTAEYFFYREDRGTGFLIMCNIFLAMFNKRYLSWTNGICSRCCSDTPYFVTMALFMGHCGVHIPMHIYIKHLDQFSETHCVVVETQYTPIFGSFALPGRLRGHDQLVQ